MLKTKVTKVLLSGFVGVLFLSLLANSAERNFNESSDERKDNKSAALTLLTPFAAVPQQQLLSEYESESGFEQYRMQVDRDSVGNHITVTTDQANQIRSIVSLLRENASQFPFRFLSISRPTNGVETAVYRVYLNSKFPFTDLKFEETPQGEIKISVLPPKENEPREVYWRLPDASLLIPVSVFPTSQNEAPLRLGDYQPLQTFEVFTNVAICLQPSGSHGDYGLFAPGERGTVYDSRERRLRFLGYSVGQNPRTTEQNYYALDVAKKVLELKNSSLGAEISSIDEFMSLYQESIEELKSRLVFAESSPLENIQSFNQDHLTQRRALRSEFEALNSKIIARKATAEEVTQYLKVFKKIQDWLAAHDREIKRLDEFMAKVKSSEELIQKFQASVKKARERRESLIASNQVIHQKVRKLFPEVFSQEWLDERLKTITDDSAIVAAEQKMAGIRWDELLKKAQELKSQLANEIGVEYELSLITAVFQNPELRNLILANESAMAEGNLFYDRARGRLGYSGSSYGNSGSGGSGGAYGGNVGGTFEFLDNGISYAADLNSVITSFGGFHAVPLYRKGDTKKAPIGYLIFSLKMGNPKSVSEHYVLSQARLEKIRQESAHNEYARSWKATAEKGINYVISGSSHVAQPVWKGIAQGIDWVIKKGTLDHLNTDLGSKVDPYMEDIREAKKLDLEALRPVDESIALYPNPVREVIRQIIRKQDEGRVRR